MTVSYGAVGAVTYSTLGGTSIAPAYPAGIAAGDMLVCFVGIKPVGGGTPGDVTAPTGWTITSYSSSDSITGGTGGYNNVTTAADTGDTGLYALTKEATGTESGTLTIALTDNNVSWAQMVRLRKTKLHWSGDYSSTTADDYAFANQTSTPTTTLVLDFGWMNLRTGGLLIGAMCVPTDVGAGATFSAEAFAASGCTFVTTEVSEPRSATGYDIGGLVVYGRTTIGIAAGVTAPDTTLTATLAGTRTNIRGPFVGINFYDTDGYSPDPANMFSFTYGDLYPLTIVGEASGEAAGDILISGLPSTSPSVATLRVFYGEFYVGDAGLAFSVYGDKSAVVPTVPTTLSDFSTRAMTTAHVDISGDVSAKTITYEDIDVTAIVQELAAQSGFDGTVQFMLRDNGSATDTYIDITAVTLTVYTNVSKSLQTIWNVDALTLVSKSLQTVWDVESLPSVSQSLQTLWNVASYFSFTAVTGGVNINIDLVTGDHFDVYRSMPDGWNYSYEHTAVKDGITYVRIIHQADDGMAAIDTVDLSAQSGHEYTYFIRTIGSDLVSYTDSSPVTVTCVLEGTWLVPIADAVGTVAISEYEYRWPNYGLQEVVDLDNAEMVFAGRKWSVVDYGIHGITQYDVKIDFPYGESDAGYADESVLRGYAEKGTLLIYRDKRGRKAYGRIDGLKFTDSQYGKMASFTFQALDIDGSV